MSDRRALEGWDWGAVPEDPDVRAFSRVRGHVGANAPIKKRHHFISVTYMDGFCGPDARLWVYRTDAPAQAHAKRPREVGFSNYYFSYRREDGTRDDDSFEDLWAAVETVWPETLAAVRGRRLSPVVSFNVLGMAAISRARVPAAREVHELLAAAGLRAQMIGAEKLGVLPPEFQRYAGRLDTVPVGANPERSLDPMREDIRRFGDLCFQLGFEVLHNNTALPFITSDNPVCIYDPRRSPLQRRPYEYDGEVELIFPIDRQTLLRGSNRLRPVNQIGRHLDVATLSTVRKYNYTVAQFAYGMAIASDRSSDRAITQTAPLVPTIDIQVRGGPHDTQIHWRHCFAPRPRLSPYIDTPLKAARLEAAMTAQAGGAASERDA